MALDKEDHWIAILGLAGVAAGYWYWHTKSKNSTVSNGTADNTTADIPAASPLIQSFDGQSSNVTTPAQVFQNSGSALTFPLGAEVSSNSQTFPIPTNS